jgi:hypothetical protein
VASGRGVEAAVVEDLWRLRVFGRMWRLRLGEDLGHGVAFYRAAASLGGASLGLRAARDGAVCWSDSDSSLSLVRGRRPRQVGFVCQRAKGEGVTP